MKTYKLLFLFLFVSSPAFAQAPVDSARVDQIVAADMAAKHTPAVQIAIAKDGRIIYSKAFGTADLENDIRATPETLFRTASVAKPITAVATLTLADVGKLDLDAPIQNYCPSFPLKPWPITTRELLSHTSGIRHYKTGDGVWHAKHYKLLSDAFVIFANDPLLFEPGTDFFYSTYGYTVVGCVLEGAAQQAYYDYLREHVLQPAGMTHTFVDNVFDIVPHRTQGYKKIEGQVKNAGCMDSSYKIPAGGLVSTAEDLVRLNSALMDGKILKHATIGEMWTPFHLRPSTGNSGAEKIPSEIYGLGWDIGESNGHKVVWHTGSQTGTNTVTALVPDEHFVVAVMANMEGTHPIDIANKVLEAFAGVTTEQPKP